jgi:hypothetical protein
MGGKVAQMVRCNMKPVWIATEKVPQKDGLCGSMSLCEEHKDKLVEKFGPDFANLTPVNQEGSDKHVS